MFVILIYGFVFLSYEVVYTYSDVLSLPVCKAATNVYILEGRLVQVTYSAYYGPPYRGVVITACNSSSTVVPLPELLNPDRLLQNETRLELRGVTWPTLLEPSQLERVDIHEITPVDVWGDCSRLKVLFIRVYADNFTVNRDWLDNCTELHELVLARLTVAEIGAVVDSAPRVTSLQLWSVRDERVSQIVREPLLSTERGRHQGIKKFELFGIERQDDNALEAQTRNNTVPAADSWEAVSAGVAWQLSLLPNLESTEINGKQFDFCPTGIFPSVTLKSLRTLRLSFTNTARFCFKTMRNMPQLTKFVVYHTTSSELNVQFNELFSVFTPQLEVHFQEVRIMSFDFVRDDYLTLSDIHAEGSKTSNVTLSGMRVRIDCNCGRTLWFARALREKLVTAPDVICEDGTKPVDLPCEWMSCQRVQCESPCVCCREGQDSILVDCRDAELEAIFTDILHLDNVTALLLPNNKITTLPDHLPHSLLWVDLAGNNVWKEGASKVHVLFTNPERRVRLAGNDVFCSCENQLLVTTLQKNRDQVDDFKSLKCVDSQQRLAELNAADLCELRDRNAELLRHGQVWLATTPVSLILAAATIALGIILHYKRREVQIFLYSRGWCLCCVQEEELDADRRYDVFLSFCHADTELVLAQLIPTLDKEYSVCIHLRDWCPGGVIPTQITLSVEQSRRTVVVLSREFVKSVWGRLEFETAHVSGLMEGRVRVVMIVIDDVLEWDDLPDDLRAYVRINTYVRWSDPWFWEKLRYALPRRSTSQLPQDNNVSGEPCIVEMSNEDIQEMCSNPVQSSTSIDSG